MGVRNRDGFVMFSSLLRSALSEDDRWIEVGGKRYWGEAGSGLLPIAENTGRILLGLRGGTEQSMTWSSFGGAVNGQPRNSAIREFREETRYYGPIKTVKAAIYKDGPFRYYNFLGIVPEEFKPVLNWEHADANWFTLDDILRLPNKHFGLKFLLSKSANQIRELVANNV